MLNDYHSCEKIGIGESDYAALIAVGCGKDGLEVSEIYYEEDGYYCAYLCGEETEIPPYYLKVFECRSWLKIYDDTGLSFESDLHFNPFGPRPNHFAIYRSGSYGTIIKMWKE